jgi:hypothetical protein
VKEWNDDENLSQKLETSIEFKDPILISESSSGPGLVSNPDIINNIWITKSIKTAKYDILSSTTLDLIAAEYEDFDILSFSESWLNSNHTDESIKLLNLHTPFRSDRGPHKMGGGVVVYIRDNINVTRRFDLGMDNLEVCRGVY